MAIKLRGNNDNLSFSKGLAKGDDGGYYIPSVNEDSVLSWVASESDMPEVESVNIRGEQGLKGESGVYVGTEEPTDDSLIWINPDGEASGELATKSYVDEVVKEEVSKIEIPEPDLSNYATKDDIPVYIFNDDGNLFITDEHKAFLESIFSKVTNGEVIDFILIYNGMPIVKYKIVSSTNLYLYGAGDANKSVYYYQYSFNADGTLKATQYGSILDSNYNSNQIYVDKTDSLTGVKASVTKNLAYIRDNYALKTDVETAITNALSAIGVAEEGAY